VLASIVLIQVGIKDVEEPENAGAGDERGTFNVSLGGGPPQEDE
jgi:hypothetical protein